MMTLFSVSRFLSSSLGLSSRNLSILHYFSTASSAETVYNHLQKSGGNFERVLTSMRLKLDAKCVSQVLQRCYPTQSQLGLRFFIWAGVYSNYRHSYFMFSKACELYEIRQNPNLIFDVLEAYRVDGCSVNLKMLKLVFNICKEAKLADEALRVLRKMPEFRVGGDNTVYNVVIRLFWEKGDLDVAESLVKEMILVNLYPDMITYMLMVKGFCSVGRLDDACGFLKLMKHHGCLPNVVVYSALLDGFSKGGQFQRALKLLGEMEKEGGDCSPNVVTYTSVIQRLCDKGRSMEALLILDRMEACGCFPNRVTISTLIKGFVVEDQIEEACKLIERVVEKQIVTKADCCNSLVLSLDRVGKHEEADKVFRVMLKFKVKPNNLVCTIMLKKLCLEGRIVDGYCLFDELEKMECLSSIESDTYSILLVGLCQQRHSAKAAKLARVMLRKGIRVKAPYIDSIAGVLPDNIWR